jgi:PadR family transcriptional regulator, regulatory protein AphA
MKTTSTEFAILGLLTLKPMSGYEMRRLIGESIGHFWGESYGQLYPSLARLEKAGLVSKRKEEGQKRDKHVYSILAEGGRKLREWLSAPPKPQPPRSELLLKLFFLTPIEAPIQRKHVIAARDRAVEELKHFGYIAEKLRAERGDHPQLQQWLITLNFGRHQAEARVRWAEETLETLKQRPAQEAEEVDEGARR